MNAQLDHVVIVAHTLEQGVAWCEATLGIVPGPGGKHPLMGTHNRLFSLATARFKRVYGEIIAVDPEAAEPPHKRWFGMDDPQLREAIRREPRLVHFVARVSDAAAACAAWAELGVDAGKPVAVSRQTPRGLLQWQITVRADGLPQMHGALPTLIQWGEAHPSDHMGDSGLQLVSLTASSEVSAKLAQAYARIGLGQVSVTQGVPGLHATVRGPRGTVGLTGGF